MRLLPSLHCSADKSLAVLIRDAGHGLDFAHPEYLYGSRHVNRRFRTGRLADERDTQPCTQHEPHAENKQSIRKMHACETMGLPRLSVPIRPGHLRKTRCRYIKRTFTT